VRRDEAGPSPFASQPDGRLVGRRGAPGSLAVKVRSYQWKAAAFFLVVSGWVASVAAALAILQIDGAEWAVHYTPSQDAVGVTAMVVGIGGAVAAVVIAVRWWRRPALQLTAQAFTIFRRHPVAIPWTMIADVPGAGSAGSAGGQDRRMVLANGQELKVRGLGRLAKRAARRQGTPGLAAPAAPMGSSMQSWLPFSVPAARPVPAYSGGGQLGRRRADQLPGPALQEVRLGFPWPQYSWIMAAPLLAGLLVLFPGGMDGDPGPHPSGIDVGGSIVVALVFEAVAALVISCCWVTLTRAVAAGPGWLAWRPRLARRWRILPLADVVSAIDLQWPRRKGVRLSRADGTGLRLRAPELAAGLGATASAQLAGHPAATAEFLAAVNPSSRPRVKPQPPDPAPNPEARRAYSAEWAESTRFQVTFLQPAYDIGQVDAFLEAIRDTFLGVREPPLTADEIRGQKFSATRLRRAYDQKQVDDFLDEVEARLRMRCAECGAAPAESAQPCGRCGAPAV
jgi:DivIVA domain-containing protein